MDKGKNSCSCLTKKKLICKSSYQAVKLVFYHEVIMTTELNNRFRKEPDLNQGTSKKPDFRQDIESMNDRSEGFLIRRMGWVMAGVWTMILLLSLLWNRQQSIVNTNALALEGLRVSHEKDLVYRRWAAEHGGIYVPVSEHTPPNPHLSHIPERDITTPSGQRLTLINPAYMTRQAQVLSEEEYGERGKITSLNPLRSENRPDSWETTALNSFSEDVKEAMVIMDIDGQPYMRLMKPFFTEEGCLRCHGHQGYQTGDILGGISVSTAMAPYLDHIKSAQIDSGVGHALIWIMGLVGIFMMTFRLEVMARERREVREEIHATLYGIGDGVISVDTKGRIIRMNAVAEEMTGWSEGGALGRPLLEVFRIINEETRLEVENPVKLVLEKGVTVGLANHTLLIAKDGTERPISDSAAPIRSETGELLGVVLVFQNQTAERSAAKALHEAHERTAAVLESISDGFMGIDFDWKFNYINSAGIKALKRNHDELLGVNVFQVFPDARGTIFENKLRKVMEKRVVTNFEIYYPLLNAWFECHCYPSETGVSIFFTDTTDRKASEQALRESEERYRNTLDNMLESCVIIDFDWKYVYINESTVRYFGHCREDLLGRNILEATPGFEKSPFFDAYKRCMEKREPDHVEGKFITSGGECAWYEARVTPVPEGIFVLSLDITARKKAEEQLRELNETLEQRVSERIAESRHLADQLRALAVELSRTEQRERKRLANILHDHIQQLLVAARLHLNMVIQNLRSKDKQFKLKEVDSIIQEIIQASRSLTIELSPPALQGAGLIGGLKWLVEHMGEMNQFKIHLQADNTAEPNLEEKRFLLFECTRELLFNVFKHSGAKEADVTLIRTRDNQAKIMVQDNGRGFDQEQLKNRGINELTFGLFSIQQRLAHMGGRMEINSTPGQGALVTLFLPIGDPKTTSELISVDTPVIEATQIRIHDGEMIRVLLVDDHEIIREGISRLLQFEWDIEVVGEAANGVEAIDLTDQLQPDVIVMDVNMPGMSGIETIRIIHGRYPHIKIIGLSMYVDKEVIDAVLDAGAVGYLTKDGPSEILLKTLRACVPARKETEPKP
jgi:PAS domain S-box-containing protein